MLIYDRREARSLNNETTLSSKTTSVLSLERYTEEKKPEPFSISILASLIKQLVDSSNPL